MKKYLSVLAVFAMVFTMLFAGSANAASTDPLLSSASLTLYAPNVDQEWSGYAPNTVFQADVSFADGTVSSDFTKATIELYDGDTLLATNTAKQLLLDSKAPGLTDLFGIGDMTATAGIDPNWNIGDYPSGVPTKAVFTLTDSSSVDHIIEAPITVVQKPGAPAVTKDDVADTITDIDATMEYSLNNGVTYTKYDSVDAPNLSGTVTVLVRVAATASVPAGEVTTLQFTAEVPYVKSIAITTQPKVAYTVGEDLDLTGLVVEGTFSDGETKVLDDLSKGTTSGYDKNVVGPQTVTFTIWDASATFVVTVSAKTSEPSTVDTDLATAKAAANALALTKADYSATSWDALQAAINDLPEGTDAEKIAKTQAINKAITDLVSIREYSDLLYDELNDEGGPLHFVRNDRDYTPDSWTSYSNVVWAQWVFVNLDNPTKEDVQQVTDDLKAAIATLVEKPFITSLTDLPNTNILLVGDYAFDLGDKANNGYDLNNFVTAAKTAYQTDTNHVYFKFDGDWYDIVADEHLQTAIDVSKLNGNGRLQFVNMNDKTIKATPAPEETTAE